MQDYKVTIERLLQQANEHDHRPQRLTLLQEAVRIADENGDVDASFSVRMKLMTSATFSGRNDVLLSAFDWCLAALDREPDRFDRKELLWNYKWALSNIVEFPDVPRKRIEAMLVDFEARYRDAGSTLHGCFHTRRSVLSDMGDIAGAIGAAARCSEVPRDSLSDCRACVHDELAGQYADTGRDEDALAEAAPILAGRMKCSHVPHRTYARLLLPLLRLGQIDEAMEFNHKGLRLIAGDPEFLSTATKHLIFLAVVGDFRQAITLVETYLGESLTTPSALTRMKFFGAVRLLLERLIADEQGSVTMRCPEMFALYQPKSIYDAAVLHSWFAAETDKIAAQFDARNGNDYYARWSANLQDWEKLATSAT